MVLKLSDLNKVKTPIKKLSKKTLRNKASKINKLLGKSPNRRIQQLTHMVNNSPNEERKAVCKNIIPDLEEQFSGIVYKKMKKRLGPKKNETYQLLSELNKEIESKNPTSLMNNFGIKRNTAKRLYVAK